MRLAAVYFPTNCLPYIFGENHTGFIINLGGEYHYTVKEDKNSLSISKESNKNFIEDFWGQNISLVSAIVGKNGIGKTSILRAIHRSIDKKKKDALYLLEEDDNLLIYNELDLKINFAFSVHELKGNAFDSVKKYYTPILDVEQVNIFSELNLVWDEQKNLRQLYLKQMLQDVKLLNDPIKNELVKVYPDFPQFKQLEIRVSQHKKFNVKSVHGATNLGTQDRINVVTNYINKDISDINEGKLGEQINVEFVKEEYLKRYLNIARSNGLNSLYDRLWDLPDYKWDENDELHNGRDFIKNFEITLFTYLIIDATFPQTPFQGGYEFQNIVDLKSFEERFNAFMELYFENIYSIVAGHIREKLGRINIEDYDQIKGVIQDPLHVKFTQSGFKSSDAVELMLRYIERFKAYYDLYLILKDSIDKKKFEIYDGYFVYDLENHKVDDFVAIVNAYNRIDELNQGLVYSLDLLSIKLPYPLSSGEKALLNFFSRINERVNKMKSNRHPIFDFYLLLLDEAELGFHPIWKRKFVNAITKCLPLIFEKVKPNRNLFENDEGGINDLKLQIIFSTHDPLTLSDIPATNVIFIDRNEDANKSFIIDREKVSLKTFGANVHDILADSFFLKNGFMGEFAQELITDLINYLTFEEDKTETFINVKHKKEWGPKKAKKVISIIDEPLIKERVESLYNKKFLYKDKKLLELKIRELQNQFNKLDNEEN